MSMRLVKSVFRWKLLFFFSLLFLLYNEILGHYLQALKWRTPPCSHGNCTKFLLVADPQLLGETNDEHFYNRLAIFDSDNFVQRTFRRALNHVKPDVIIFLGDIFDEGSISTSEEYERYMKRFKRIFHQPHPSIPVIVVPGDNDIGGENGEILTQQKVARFRSAFETRPFYSLGTNVIYPVNRITREIPHQVPTWKDLDPKQRSIAVSHFSLLFHQDDFSDRVLKMLQPHIIFSGHLHRSMFLRRSQVYTELTKATPLSVGTDRYQVHEFDLAETIQRQIHLEILVPTCSYRMGERNMGYGYAVLDHSNDNLSYTVLWSVDRFQQLFNYLSFLSIWLIIGLAWTTLRIRRRCHRRKLFNYDKV